MNGPRGTVFSHTIQRGPAEHADCEVCGRDVTVTPTGLIRAHRSMRVGRDGKPYVAYDNCPGGTWPVRWPEGRPA
jgi:hypothetical protein